MPEYNESRPQANPGAAKSFGGDKSQSTVPIDIVALASHEWHIFMDGFESGFTNGIDHGRRLADEEAAARHRAAANVVVAMTKVPIVDQDEAAARRARIDARFGGA